MSKIFLTNLDEDYAVEQEFQELIDTMTDDEWWEWVRSWLDEGFIVNIYEGWNTELKKEAIEDIKKILNKQDEHKKEAIEVPIYFYEKDKKIIIDEEGIREEFENKLKEVIKKPKKFLEI